MPKHDPPTIFEYLAARERGPEAVAALWAGVTAPQAASEAAPAPKAKTAPPTPPEGTQRALL